MDLQKILEDRDHPIWSIARSGMMALIIYVVLRNTASDYSLDDKQRIVYLILTVLGGEGLVKSAKALFYGEKHHDG